MNKTLVIHHDNTFIDDNIFENDIYFNTDETVDKYISDEIISEIKKFEFDIVFIKDNLSDNYLELLGLRVAYHIRLIQDKELGNKKFTPIVILSDLDGFTLNKLEPMANILFTKNIFIIPNTKGAIKEFFQKDISPLTKEQYQQKFLDKIIIEKPKDTSGNHGIANKWSIYKWADLLRVKGDAIDQNNAEIENMLYFKYLKEKSLKKEISDNTIITPMKKGKVLLIDDEWNKGWNDILSKIFVSNRDIEFETFKYDYKDKTNFNLIVVQLKHKELKKQIEDADVVILDLRLLGNDHENDDIDDYSGIKILKKIHEINAGIQVIMLTATSKSTILEKLYEYKILGYIKKEHPDDKSIDTVENINKFIKLVDEGLKRKYLKQIYVIMNEIINILNIDFTVSMKERECEIFKKFNISKKQYIKFTIKIHQEALYTFEILDSTMKNRFIYAMLSIVSSFEAINSIFIKEYRYDDDKFWDNTIAHSNNLNDKLEELYTKLGGKDKLNIATMIRNRNNYLHSNIKPVHIEPNDILNLFEAELKMIRAI